MMRGIAGETKRTKSGISPVEGKEVGADSSEGERVNSAAKFIVDRGEGLRASHC
jgi:hypothetical protein